MTRKIAFFEGWSWFNFNNLGLALGTNLKFYTNLPRRLKLKVTKFWALTPKFVEVTGEKLLRGGGWKLFLSPPLYLQSWIGLKINSRFNSSMFWFGDLYKQISLHNLTWIRISKRMHSWNTELFITCIGKEDLHTNTTLFVIQRMIRSDQSLSWYIQILIIRWYFRI